MDSNRAKMKNDKRIKCREPKQQIKTVLMSNWLRLLCFMVFTNTVLVVAVNRGDVLYLIKSTWTTIRRNKQLKRKEGAKMKRKTKTTSVEKTEASQKWKNYHVCGVWLPFRRIHSNKRHIIVFQLQLFEFFSFLIFNIQFRLTSARLRAYFFFFSFDLFCFARFCSVLFHFSMDLVISFLQTKRILHHFS